jgi:transglutaminase-like putative cysteine protease
MSILWATNSDTKLDITSPWKQIIACGWQDFLVDIKSDKDLVDLKNKSIILTTHTIQELWSWDITTAASMLYYHTTSQLLAKRSHEKHLINSILLARDPAMKTHISKLHITGDPTTYSVYFQAFFATVYFPHIVSLEVKAILDTAITKKDWTTESFEAIVRSIGSVLMKENMIDSLYTKEKSSHTVLLRKLYQIWQEYDIRTKLRDLEQQRKNLCKARNNQATQKEEKKKEDKNPVSIEQNSTSQKQDSYKPQDSIRESNDSSNRTVKDSREAPITWYIKTNSMQVFNAHTLQRSTEHVSTKDLVDDHAVSPTHRHTVHTTHSWAYEYNIPYGYKPVFVRGNAYLQVNQSWDYTLHVKTWWEIKIWLVQSQIPPEDTYDYTKPLFHTMPSQIMTYLESYKTPSEKLQAIKSYILKKIYSTQYQWTIVSQSTWPDQYIANLRDAPKLECYSANHLFVALARSLWYEAKLSVWYHTKFIHDGKSYITADDWHAWAEIKVNNAWQIVDVTPTTPDPTDKQPEESEEQEEQEEQEILDEILSQQEKQDLENQINSDVKNDPYEVQVLTQEWISPDEARDFYNRMEKMKLRAQKIASSLQKLFEDNKYIERHSYAHTRHAQTKIDLQKILTEEPSALLWDPKAILNLQKTPFYLQKQTHHIEQKQYPDEIVLTCAVDVSWSMDDYQETTKDYLTLLRLTFAQLYSLMQKHWTVVKMECYGFGDKSKKYALSNTADYITMSMGAETMVWIARLFAQIPSGMQTSCGSWNAENDFYKKLIYENYIPPNENNPLKKIVKLGISCTDQQTLKNSSPDDNKQITMPDNETILPWSDENTRLSDLLSYLHHTCHLPMIALNTSWSGKVKDSWYAHYLSADESMDTKLATLLSWLIKPTISKETDL